MINNLIFSTKFRESLIKIRSTVNSDKCDYVAIKQISENLFKCKFYDDREWILKYNVEVNCINIIYEFKFKMSNNSINIGKIMLNKDKSNIKDSLYSYNIFLKSLWFLSEYDINLIYYNGFIGTDKEVKNYIIERNLKLLNKV